MGRRALGVVALLILIWIGSFFVVPRTLPQTPFSYDLRSGNSLRAVAYDLFHRGVIWDPWMLALAGRLTGQQSHIKSGSYEWDRPMTGWQLLTAISRGDGGNNQIQLIEGMTFAQFRRLLDDEPALQHQTQGLDDASLMNRLGMAGVAPEGFFYPDTYFFNKGDSDQRLLQRAYQAMDRHLAQVWSKRAAGLPYTTPYQILTMASIIEKETGNAAERGLVAAVFANRLEQGMRLQTDPTVIYGLGPAYDGHLHRRDLVRDTPFNTYTRSGLPPTPIAMPGLAALRAAAHPERVPYLYFVARGDGTHQFSSTLEQHNQAVEHFQLKKE